MGKLHRFFFYLTILLLPTQLGLHWWPQWATVLGRRIDYLSPTIYFTDVLIFLILISWVASPSFWQTSHRARPESQKDPGQARMTKKLNKNWGPLIIIGLLVSLNIFFAINKPVAIFHWLKVLEFALFGFYIIKTKPKLLIINYALAIAIFYSSLIAIAQFFLQHSIGGLLWFLGERTFTNQTPGIAQINWCFPNFSHCQLLLRPYATFPHPNVLGGFLAVTVPILISQIRQMSQIRKIFYVSTILVGLIALVLTFSRSAWIVGVLGIAWVLFHFKPKNFIPFAIIIFLLGSMFVKNFDATSESVIVREQLNVTAINIWQHSPIFGVGLGNFLIELPKTLPSRTVYFLQPVHNIYLLVLSETGIVGLCGFFFLLWYVLKKSKIFKFQIIAFLLLGLVDHYPLTLQQGQLLLTFFLSLGLTNKGN